MAYDLEEQEQLETLKAWWKQYGNLVTWALIAVLGSYAAWNGWQTYQRKQSGQASQLYEELIKAADAKDAVKVQRATDDLIAQYASTTYASMGALSAAKTSFDAGDLKAARSRLQWVIDHATVPEYQVMAKLRLAGVALDEKAYDEGLKLLSGEFPEQFTSEVADRKGDILQAQNKPAEARAAYQLALNKFGKQEMGRDLIELKLGALGVAAVANNNQQ